MSALMWVIYGTQAVFAASVGAATFITRQRAAERAYGQGYEDGRTAGYGEGVKDATKRAIQIIQETGDRVLGKTREPIQTNFWK